MSNNEKFDSLLNEENVDDLEILDINEDIAELKKLDAFSTNIVNEEKIEDKIEDKIEVQDGIYVIAGQDLTHSAEIINNDEELAASVHIETEEQVVEDAVPKKDFIEVKLNDTVKEPKAKNNYIKYSFGLVAVAAVVIAGTIAFTMNIADKKNNTVIGGNVHQTEKPKATILNRLTFSGGTLYGF